VDAGISHDSSRGWSRRDHVCVGIDVDKTHRDNGEFAMMVKSSVEDENVLGEM
jgi:hypothetical protein